MSSVSQVVYVDIDKIQPNNYNPNVMDKEKFKALVDFCNSNGADKLDPIWIRNNGVGGYEIIDGEHRWRAGKEVGWQRIRAFIIRLGQDESKAFNVRKNRERGKLDVFKLGKIFLAEMEKGTQCNEIAKKYGYLSHGTVSEIIGITQKEKEIRKRLGVGATTSITFGKAFKIFRELKRQEQGKPKFEPTEESQGLEKFLTRYAHALKTKPQPNIQKDEIEVAIGFFKRLLNDKHITCPTCGEQHLQWKCGHEF